MKAMKLNTKNITCCYFGIHGPTGMARDSVLIRGLKESGVRVVSCVDASTGGLKKLIRLARKHKKINHDYDFMLVGYLSNIAVVLARLISRKKIVFNALSSMYEGAVLDRSGFGRRSLKEHALWLVDFFAFHAAHIILVESEEQKEFVVQLFKVPRRKLVKIWTGADDAVFHPDPNVQKRHNFTAVFRGWFLPATGVEYVIEAARILRNEPIDFLLIGRGILLDKVLRLIEKYELKNLELIADYLPDDILREKILSSHIMLGQFSGHPRLDRTIQYKTFEALALGMPYITRDSKSNREVLHDRENCLFVRPADAKDLVSKILELRDNPELRDKLGRNAYLFYKEKLTPKVLAQQLLAELRSLSL
jgi:glycosyltransferase involved in cell wall biosynthesis